MQLLLHPRLNCNISIYQFHKYNKNLFQYILYIDVLLFYIFASLGDHKVRNQVDGSLLPRPRDVQLFMFLEKTNDLPDSNNYHLSQFGQWLTHDISLLPPDFSGKNEFKQHNLLKFNI